MENGLDYLLKLGLDTEHLKKEKEKLEKTLAPVVKKLEKAEKKRHTAQNKTLALKQKEIALAKRQVTIEKQIRAAEFKGGKGFSRIREMSGKGDAKSIGEAELLLKKKLLAFETRHRAEVKARREEEARLSTMNKNIAGARKEEAKRLNALKKAELEIQKRITREQAATAKKKAPRNPDENISYQARTSLQERVKSARDGKYSVTDPRLISRINRAKIALNELNKEVTETKSQRALIKMRIRYAEIQREIASAVRDQKALNRALHKGNTLSKSMSRSIKSFGLHFVGAYAVAGAAKHIYETGKELDSLQASLLAASGGFEAAKEDFKFLEATSIDLGKSLTTLVGGYNKVAIAGRTAGFSAEENKNIFLAASEASTAYGLSQERTNLVMLAFSQMINKGKVSMEEISRQLGETLPGGVALAAKSMGYATDEVGKFIKQVESGKLLTKDFIHNFSKTLREEVRLTGSLAAGKKKLTSEQQRLTASYESMINEVFQGGGANSLSKTFKNLSTLLNENRDSLVGLLGGFIDLTTAIADFVIVMTRGVLWSLDRMGRILSLGFSTDGIGFIISLFENVIAVIYKTISVYSSFIELLKNIGEHGIIDGGKAWWDTAKAARAAYKEGANAEHTRRVEKLREKAGAGTSNTTNVEKIELTSYNSDPAATTMEFETFLQEKLPGLLSY